MHVFFRQDLGSYSLLNLYTHALNSYTIAVGTTLQARARNAIRAVGTALLRLDEKIDACVFPPRFGILFFAQLVYARA